MQYEEAKVTISGVEDKPGIASKIFSSLADANIVVDMIIQNASADGKMISRSRYRNPTCKRASRFAGNSKRNWRHERSPGLGHRQGIHNRAWNAVTFGCRGEDVHGPRAGGGSILR